LSKTKDNMDDSLINISVDIECYINNRINFYSGNKILDNVNENLGRYHMEYLYIQIQELTHLRTVNKNVKKIINEKK